MIISGRFLRRIFPLALLLGLTLPSSGQESEQSLNQKIRATLLGVWRIQPIRHGLERYLERMFKEEVNKQFPSPLSFPLPIRIPGWDRGASGVDDVDVDIGTFPPVFTASNVINRETRDAIITEFAWAMDWPRGNRASLKFDIDMIARFLFDPRVEITRFNFKASGRGRIVQPKWGGQGTTSFSVDTVDTRGVKAKMDIIGLKIDVTDFINGPFVEGFLEPLVGQTFEQTFDGPGRIRR